MEQWALLGFRGAVEEFKRHLIEAALRQSGGNRTHAARSLGLQRTYLLRLMRDLGVSAPPSGSLPGFSWRPDRCDLLPPSCPWMALARPVPAKSVDTPRTPGVK